ncbi:Protein T19D2.1, partial [Aphelenchoides avenae]
PALRRQLHSRGDVASYICLFCDYQLDLSFSDEAKSRRWDHAVLLTGYDLHLNGDRTIAG